MKLGSSVLGGGYLGSRLFRRIREDLGFIYVSMHLYQQGASYGMFGISGTIKTNTSVLLMEKILLFNNKTLNLLKFISE